MAKYSDGVTEAVAGDVVECIHDGFDLIKLGQTFTVKETDGAIAVIAPGKYTTGMFRLIRRAPSPEPEQPAVNNEQSPPLVVWPKEKRNELRWEQLEPGEYFVFDLDNYRDRIYFRCENGFLEGLDPIGRRAPRIEDVQSGSLFYPVRRVRMTALPQFTVI